MASSTPRRHGRWEEDQTNFDDSRHGCPDVGQINWEDVENSWQAWVAASDQGRPWHDLSAGWRGEHQHLNIPDAPDDEAEANNADGVHEAHDGADHEDEQQPDDDAENVDDNGGHDGAGHDGEQEDHHGPGHGAQAACDDQTGDTEPAAPAQDLQAGAQDQQGDVGDDAHHDETEANDAEGVHEPRDGADHEHQGPGGDTTGENASEDGDNEHGGHRGSRHDGSEGACEDSQGEIEAKWNDTFVWSDMSTWGDVSPTSHEDHVPDMSPDMDMDFGTGSDDEGHSGPSADAHHGSDDGREIMYPAPAAADWHSLL